MPEQCGTGSGDLSHSISSNPAVGIFEDISKWTQIHSIDAWFHEAGSIDCGKLLRCIEECVFYAGLDSAARGFVQAMLLAEHVLVHGHSKPWDQVMMSKKDVRVGILDCSNASYSSKTHLDEIRRQLYDCAWVRCLIASSARANEAHALPLPVHVQVRKCTLLGHH
jgi:hypothetical protein